MHSIALLLKKMSAMGTIDIFYDIRDCQLHEKGEANPRAIYMMSKVLSYEILLFGVNYVMSNVY